MFACADWECMRRDTLLYVCACEVKRYALPVRSLVRADLVSVGLSCDALCERTCNAQVATVASGRKLKGTGDPIFGLWVHARALLKWHSANCL